MQVEKLYGARWRLLAPLVYDSDLIGRITVTAGFVTDLDSTPRWPFAWWLAGRSADNPSVIHDWLCSGGAAGDPPQPVSRRTADAVFFEAMEVTKVPAWRRWAMWAAVRAYGLLWADRRA